MLVTTDALFQLAYGKYAIGAYNINNMEQALGLFQGAVEAQAPIIVQIDLTTAAGVRVQKVLALKDEIALSLSVSDVRLYRKDGAIRVEVPRTRPSTVRLLPLVRSLPKLPPLAAVLGVDEEGVPLLLRLPSPDVAHVLVAGTTGSIEIIAEEVRRAYG